MPLIVLDGDNIRHGLNRDLGFTEADRAENIRRVAEVARLMVDAGFIVLVAFISPFRAERRQARSLFGEGEFVEVFVDTLIEVRASGSQGALRQGAHRGAAELHGDSPLRTPESAEVHLRAANQPVDDCVEQVLAALS